MSEAVPTRRPWWKLHFSTKVVIAMVVLGLVLANVPEAVAAHIAALTRADPARRPTTDEALAAARALGVVPS